MPTNNNKNYIGAKYIRSMNQGKTYQYYDKSPELDLVIKRAIDEGYTLPNENTQIALDQYIKSLKANGIWYKQDIIFNFAYNDLALSNFSRINLKNPLAVTNLITYSTDFSNISWNALVKTINTTETLAPDGSQTACKISDNPAGGDGNTTKSNIVANNTTVTYSIYTKAGTAVDRAFLLRNVTTSTNLGSIATFNYATGTFTSGGIDWIVQSLPNGWFRLSRTYNTGFSIGDTLQIYYGRAGGSVVGSTATWYVWGAQLEDREKASKYQPTFDGNPIYGNGVCMTFNNPTYTINGYEGNGTNAYIDTRFNPTVTGRNYTLNDSSRSYVLYKDGGTNSRREGVLANNANCTISAASTTAIRINQGTTDFTGGLNTTGTGFHCLVRNSATNVSYFKAPSELNRTVNSTLVTSANQTLLGFGNVFGTDGMTCYMMGGSMIFSEKQAFRTIHNTYLTKIGLTPIA